MEKEKERALKIRGRVVRGFLGGMAYGISGPRLAAAAASGYLFESGDFVGTIAASLIGIDQPDYVRNPKKVAIRELKKAIREFRRNTNGILGVNIMFAVTNYSDLVTAAIEENVDAIFSGAGLARDLPSYLTRYSKTKLVIIVSSAQAARIICQIWWKRFGCLPDAFVVEGFLAGGHLGFKKEEIGNPRFALEVLLKEVLDEIRPFEIQHNKIIPVFVGGGVSSGEKISNFLDLGASGVQLSSPFVPTHECDADLEFKRVYLNAREKDVVIIISPVGMLGRAVRNPFLDEITNGVKRHVSCRFKCLKRCNPLESPYCIAEALLRAQQGDLTNGFAFIGAKGWEADRIISVEEVFEYFRGGLRIL
ncbi:MAG: nitronate monooxygenase family protein [bacterium]